jgi:hypothetical protein
MKLTFNEKMHLADQFELVSDHPWRAQYYQYDKSADQAHIDDYGLVMVEMLQGKYQVCRVERFSCQAHFPGHPVKETIDYQPKYYGEFSHNQLLKAFQLAAEIHNTPLTTNTVEV